MGWGTVGLSGVKPGAVLSGRKNATDEEFGLPYEDLVIGEYKDPVLGYVIGTVDRSGRVLSFEVKGDCTLDHDGLAVLHDGADLVVVADGAGLVVTVVEAADDLLQAAVAGLEGGAGLAVSGLTSATCSMLASTSWVRTTSSTWTATRPSPGGCSRTRRRCWSRRCWSG